MTPQGPSPRASVSVSVVVPTWNEAGAIAGALESVLAGRPDEVIVADADSPDGTSEIARVFPGVTVVSAPRGRAAQQNVGARAATGDVLLFLHADCRLEPGALGTLRRFVASHPKVPAGCFRMAVDHDGPAYRLIGLAADVRAGLLGLPYGDQAIFARRSAFLRVGGFPPLALMEDLYLSARLRRLGRLSVVPARVRVSPRRWESRGLVRQTALNWSLTAAAAAGVSPNALARFYAVVR